jgi:hypothetical protein
MGETMATCASSRALRPFRSAFGRVSRKNDKNMKLFIFLSLSGSSSALFGCGATAQNSLESQMIADLESENARLQTEVTTLQEQKLEAERSACQKRPDRKPEKSPQEAPPERPELPVVRMVPQDKNEEGPSQSAGNDKTLVSIRPSSFSEEEEGVPPGTRPVLKVRGEHEAWVYHRPLEAGESNTTPPAIEQASGGSPAGDQ